MQKFNVMEIANKKNEEGKFRKGEGRVVEKEEKKGAESTVMLSLEEEERQGC